MQLLSWWVANSDFSISSCQVASSRSYKLQFVWRCDCLEVKYNSHWIITKFMRSAKLPRKKASLTWIWYDPFLSTWIHEWNLWVLKLHQTCSDLYLWCRYYIVTIANKYHKEKSKLLLLFTKKLFFEFILMTCLVSDKVGLP